MNDITAAETDLKKKSQFRIEIESDALKLEACIDGINEELDTMEEDYNSKRNMQFFIK